MFAASSAAPALRSVAEREGAAAFVLSLRERGVVSRSVLRAMEVVPRHVFAPRRYADLARSDVALPLAGGQTMSAPATVAAMLVALDVRAGQRVLEVGTGSGYVTALLAEMGAEVHSVERHPVLQAGARARLDAAGRSGRVHLYGGDGLGPPPDEIRFDRILLNGSLARIPDGVAGQIAGCGRLVGALAIGRLPVLVRLECEPSGQREEVLGPTLRIGALLDQGERGPVACNGIVT